MPVQVTPYVPRTITVHMGAPDEWAENVTVSFPDYVKNVASSEIYPTWEPAAIQANILAITSFALNRVYTEFYPSRGYDFQITSTTAYDQKFIRDRNIFENISRTVDEMFTDYIRREGFVEPLAAKFCNGTTSTCAGLSQWGSQELAQQGYGPMEILRYYYGDDIELVENAPVQSLGQSYPGYPLRLGSTGPDVVTMKTMLNRISQGYPAIPKLWPVTRTFDEKTQSAVRTFQSVFGLTADGVVGKATWYKMVYLYVGLSRLSELVSMGQQFQGQRIALGLLADGGQVGLCQRHPMALQQPGCGFPVQHQVPGREQPQYPCHLKRHEPAGQFPPAEQQELPVRAVPQQGAEGLLGIVVVQVLQIVQDKGAPGAIRGRQRQGRLPGGQGDHPFSGSQSLGCNRLAKAGGRTEKHRPAPARQLLIFLNQGIGQDGLHGKVLSCGCMEQGGTQDTSQIDTFSIKLFYHDRKRFVNRPKV